MCRLFCVIFVTIIVPTASIECLSPFQCSNQTVNDTEYTYGYGYKSIFGKGTRIANTECNVVNCAASHSCKRNGIVDVACNLWGYGVDSLSFGQEVIYSKTQINCAGASACLGSILISDGDIRCHGDKSCVNTIIKGTPSIKGQGAYSLMNSIVDSKSTKYNENNSSITMDITLRGYYAGYNTTVVCQDGDTCSITCYGNSCFNTFFKCHNNAICNVNNCNKNESIDCPIYVNFSDSISDNNDLLFDIFNNNNNSTIILDITQIMKDINDECDSNSNALTYDDKVEEFGNAIVHDAGPICCRGFRACGYGNITQNQTDENASVVCSASDACVHSELIKIGGLNGTVYCTAGDGCFGANIVFDNGGTVYCSGYSRYGIIATCKINFYVLVVLVLVFVFICDHSSGTFLLLVVYLELNFFYFVCFLWYYFTVAKKKKNNIVVKNRISVMQLLYGVMEVVLVVLKQQ